MNNNDLLLTTLIMTEATSYPMDAEDMAAEAEMKGMSAQVDGFLEEMKQSQKEIDRLHKENSARIDRIKAAVNRLASR